MADPGLNGGGVDPALQALVDSLAGNVPPAPPGFWPPPPLVWLTLALVLLLLALGCYGWYRGRVRRRYLRALNQLRRTGGRQALTRLHALLRNAAARRDGQAASLSEDEFARRVADTLGREEAPPWVNAHYRPQAGVKIDWRQARRLIRRWCR